MCHETQGVCHFAAISSSLKKTRAPNSGESFPSSMGTYVTPALHVGAPGFEPGTSCSQSRRANQAALHPVRCATCPARRHDSRADVRKCTGKHLADRQPTASPGPSSGCARARPPCLCGQLSASGRSPGPVSLKPKSPPANSDLPIIGQYSCIQP